MTKNIDRRALLGMFAVSTPFLLMGAQCATQVGQIGTAANVTSQLVADVQGIASGLQVQFPSIAKALTSAQATQVQGYLGTLSSLASSIGTSLSQGAAQPKVSQIISVVQQIAGVAGPLLPPPWGIAISAAIALLPAIAAAVQLAMPPQAGGLSVSDARRALGIPTL